MSGEPSAVRFAPGQMLAGKYRFERLIGEGGMGLVVEARHVMLDQPVALKVLRREALAHKGTFDRFLREARAAVKLESQHVARVIDVGLLEDGAPYIAMELLRGQDLAAYLREHGRMSAAMAVDSALQALDALAEAHSIGVVHRDLKPANLFLVTRSDGTQLVKVLDFGISKVVGDAAQALITAPTTIMGSPMYMPPEQIRSARNVDMRADVWGMGVTLYELLTARQPFLGETMAEIIASVLESDPVPIHIIASDVPAEVERIVTRCLCKDPKGRFADVATLAEALVPFGSGAAVRANARAATLSAKTRARIKVGEFAAPHANLADAAAATQLASSPPP